MHCICMKSTIQWKHANLSKKIYMMRMTEKQWMDQQKWKLDNRDISQKPEQITINICHLQWLLHWHYLPEFSIDPIQYFHIQPISAQICRHLASLHACFTALNSQRTSPVKFQQKLSAARTLLQCSIMFSARSTTSRTGPAL